MIKAFFDGSCWPNPGGIAAYGWVASDGEGYYKEGSGIIGQGAAYSNNVAEYRGLYECLKFLKADGKENEQITICGDSKLVIEQLNGRWKVKKGLYVETYRLAFKILSGFKSLKIEWIPREQNNEADYLSKKHLGIDVMDEAFKNTIGGENVRTA